MKRFKNVLAIVDDNAQLQVAAMQAARLAARNHGKLKLVKVIREFGWVKRLKRYLRESTVRFWPSSQTISSRRSNLSHDKDRPRNSFRI